jgi:hypothetical protein
MLYAVMMQGQDRVIYSRYSRYSRYVCIRVACAVRRVYRRKDGVEGRDPLIDGSNWIVLVVRMLYRERRGCHPIPCHVSPSN